LPPGVPVTVTVEADVEDGFQKGISTADAMAAIARRLDVLFGEPRFAIVIVALSSGADRFFRGVSCHIPIIWSMRERA
jgi:hypothetical protein